MNTTSQAVIDAKRGFEVARRWCEGAAGIALIQTPHRFRTKRQLWAYGGLALATRTSAEYRFLDGQLQPVAARQQRKHEHCDSTSLKEPTYLSK